MQRRMTVVSLMALLFLSSVFAFGDDKAKVKGMINTRTGETLIVQSGGQNTTVVLTDDTKTRDRKGLFGLDKQQISSAVLIPGLKISVDGVPDTKAGLWRKPLP